MGHIKTCIGLWEGREEGPRPSPPPLNLHPVPIDLFFCRGGGCCGGGKLRGGGGGCGKTSLNVWRRSMISMIIMLVMLTIYKSAFEGLDDGNTQPAVKSQTARRQRK